jgi:hypothetical protein
MRVVWLVDFEERRSDVGSTDEVISLTTIFYFCFVLFLLVLGVASGDGYLVVVVTY